MCPEATSGEWPTGLPSPLLWRSGHIIVPGVGGSERRMGGQHPEQREEGVVVLWHQGVTSFPSTKSCPKAIELTSQLGTRRGKARVRAASQSHEVPISTSSPSHDPPGLWSLRLTPLASSRPPPNSLVPAQPRTPTTTCRATYQSCAVGAAARWHVFYIYGQSRTS